MSIIDLQDGSLSVRVLTLGGVLLDYSWTIDNHRIALLRPAPDEADASSSACYPLVPFGNRIRNNRFTFAGRDYQLRPNTVADPHYLHGDGWQAEWSILSRSSNELQIGFRHQESATPYSYEARQTIALSSEGLTLHMSVENVGKDALPFGLGWHPYFPMTAQTTLFAPARRFWTETEGWLPGERTDIPADLDFSQSSPLPRRWVNNGFEGWSGEAQITWPERRASLKLTADAAVRHAFIFIPDTSFNPAFRHDYFCFEPMSHLANGHNLPDLGDLKILQPGETLAGSIRLQPQRYAD
ncbi:MULTISPECIES: aldose 1-epimerase [Rhizobium]|uniref:Aldose 1-epimerase n=1 Tax=Rhizobium miluonense TaxID=411945 RepID=A0A1C3WW76_9HYPH|nr:aldose 1-epimerase [Rhizobium miluonense]SCB44252.1 aldose 1-epimerase [Rhizobium miluonense]